MKLQATQPANNVHPRALKSHALQQVRMPHVAFLTLGNYYLRCTGMTMAEMTQRQIALRLYSWLEVSVNCISLKKFMNLKKKCS